MGKVDSTRLTETEGRRFGWTLAIAFGIIAALAQWSGRDRAPLILAIAAGVFFFAGALLPTRLGPVQRAWMSLAHAISRITTPIFLGVVYFLVLTPTGLIRRALSKQSLRRDRSKASFWLDRPRMDREALRRRMERQF